MKLNNERAKWVCGLWFVGVLMLGQTIFAQTPGTVFPAASDISDQKLGSVLIYNFIASSAANPTSQETEISLTNTNGAQAVGVRFFFINGNTGAVTQRLVTLNANQTTSLYASQVAPDVRGYAVAVAVDATSGCPVSFNFLRGSAFFKLPSGHQTRLGALGVAALFTGTLSGCAGGTTSARLSFDGVSYNRLPRTVAIDSLSSRNDGNDTVLVVNRLSGSLLANVTPMGAVSGLLFDDATNAVEFSDVRTSCQIFQSLSNTFPRTVPRFEMIIPSGRSGWLSLFSVNNLALSGAVINFNSNAGSQSSAFGHGHNLHTVTLAPSTTLDIPITPLPSIAAAER